MPDNSIVPVNTSALPLRLEEPQFNEGEWPCAAERLGLSINQLKGSLVNTFSSKAAF